MRYVYLMRNDETGRYKIGISKDPTKRLEQLQTGNDGDLVLINQFKSEYSTKIETAMQNSYSHTRKRGEWFDIHLEEEQLFISECIKIEKNIKYLLESGNIFI